jgi:hypothetical protein
LTGTGIAGAKVTLSPAAAGSPATTDADGNYTLGNVPVGVYALTFGATNFTNATGAASVTAGQTATANMALAPTAPVVVKATLTGDAEPDGTLTASVTVTPLDGSTVESLAWTSHGIEVEVDDPAANSTAVTLPDLEAYKEHLLTVIDEAPKVREGLLNRFMVQPINPLDLEEGALVALTATVTTSSGEYTATAQTETSVPWKVTAGLQNVPVGETLLFQGKEQEDYDWALTEVPSGSTALLTDATTRNPYFTPDKTGKYTLTVTDTTVDPPVQVAMNIYAGTWEGAISGIGTDGRPLSANCTGCHNDVIAPDKFTAWKRSGHAEIFTVNFDTPGHYSTACLPCHTVGFDTTVSNNGFDDVKDYQAFLDEYTTDGVNFHSAPGNWANLVDELQSNTLLQARLANVQCENCHGPNLTGLHHSGSPDEVLRFSTSATVCAVCHGEPPRHARYQQWLESGHANFEVAIAEGTNASCARCHSAQGFLQWYEAGLPSSYTVPNPATADTVQPQTCATCHDPHYPGSASGNPNNATVRVIGSTPVLPAGFATTGDGRGAICMMCHNTRRGLKNDQAQPPSTTPATGQAPHPGAQTDVLFGQNAYLVKVGIRGKHSLISDTCANCHLEKTPPPPDLSYASGGTNHTFFASPAICVKCHNSIDGPTFQNIVQEQIDVVEGEFINAITEYTATVQDNGFVITVSNVLPPGQPDGSPTVTVTIETTDAVAFHDFTDLHGQQAISFSVNGTEQGLAQLDSFKITPDETAVSMFQYSHQGDLLERGGWNIELVKEDTSKGVHNPTFVFDILDATLDMATQTDFGTLTPF